MLRADFTTNPRAHLIAPRTAFESRASRGAAITRYRRSLSLLDIVVRSLTVVVLLASIALWMTT